RRRHPAAGLRDHPQGGGRGADRKTARRPQRRCRVRQAEDHRRKEGGGGVSAPHRYLEFGKRGGSTRRALFGYDGVARSAVIPRECGVSSTPRPCDESQLSLEYWIARLRGR